MADPRVCLSRVLTVLALFLAGGASAQPIRIRVTPPENAQLLPLQVFDLRVEATSVDPAGIVSTLTVTVDGIDITSRGQVTSPSPQERNWTLRAVQLGVSGNRVIAASAAGSLSGSPLSGTGQSTVTVRSWGHLTSAARQTLEDPKRLAAALDGDPRFQRPHGRDRFGRVGEPAGLEETLNTLHLGAKSPLFHQTAAEGQPRARNVVLFIGDGMGVAHRTAARVLSKGYTHGKAHGTTALDRFPYNGLLMTSSLDALITDSAPGAHVYATGNKTNNGMAGVFPDNTQNEADNPRIQNLSEWARQNLGLATGVVSDAFLTDATPAAFLAHTQSRFNGTLIASQYVDLSDINGLKVLLGGGAFHFIPRSQAGSRRADERNVVAELQARGFTLVHTRSQLRALDANANAKLIGLFHLDNMNVAYDKLRMGDAAVTAAFPDQPFLSEMTEKAIQVLRQDPNGFFLMVEGALIDKQSHAMDAERSIYDVIQLAQAVEVAFNFAIGTNSDADPDNDTLVIVTADHECSGLALAGVGRPEKAGTRDYIKTYQYADIRNDPTTLNFPEYVDANGDGYPDNPGVGKKLIMSFGANPDRFEDWQPGAWPRAPSVFDAAGVAVANPAEAPGSVFVSGSIGNGAAGGDAHASATHTMTDIPISAYGPGSSQFARVQDNTEAFFAIVNALLGTYPRPTLY